MSAYAFEIIVPGSVVPTIVGKNGLHIQKLRDIFRVELFFIDNNSGINKDRILRIQGIPKNIEHAQKKIMNIITGKDDIFDLMKKNNSFKESKFYVPVLVAKDVVGFDNQNLKEIKFSLNLISLETDGTCFTSEKDECLILNIQGSVEKVDQAIQLLQYISDAFMSAKNQYNADFLNKNTEEDQTLKFEVEDNLISQDILKNVDLPNFSRFALRLTEINTANFKRICKENYNAALKVAMEVFVNSSNNKEKLYFKSRRVDLLSEVKKLKNEIETKNNRINGILAEVDQLQKEKQNFVLTLGKLKIRIEALNGSDVPNLICKMCNEKPVVIL